MEDNGDAVRKPSSDIFTRKRVGVSKGFFKHSNSFKSDSKRNKISYLPKTGNPSCPVDKKYDYYGNDSESFVKAYSVINSRPQLILSTAINPSQAVVQSGHDLNGNISLNSCTNFYNFPTPASDVSSLNSLFSYQSKQYELAANKSVRHKHRTNFPEQRSYSSRTNDSFGAGKYFSFPVASPGCYCAKNVSQKYPVSKPFLNVSDQPSFESFNMSKKYSSKYDVKYVALPEICLKKDIVSLTDLPVLVNTNLSTDTSMTSKFEFYDKKSKISRHNTSKKWNHPSTTDYGECSKTSEFDQMLFPTLPSNNQQGVISGGGSKSVSMHSRTGNVYLESPLVTGGSLSTSASPTASQASYADVIRMSAVTCSEVEASFSLNRSTPVSEQSLVGHTLSLSINEKLQKEENSQLKNSDWILSKLAHIDLNAPESVSGATLSVQNGQNIPSTRPVVVSLEKPSFYNASLQASKNTMSTPTSNSSHSSDKGMENENLLVDCISSTDTICLENSMRPGSTNRSSVSSDFTNSTSEMQIASTKTDSNYGSPTSICSFGETFNKTIDDTNANVYCVLEKDPPVIIMNNFSLPHSISGISFGIEYDEMVKLCSDTCDDQDNTRTTHVHEDDVSDKTSDAYKSCSVMSKPSCENHFPSLNVDVSAYKRISVNGKDLYWKESDVVYSESNLLEFTKYLSTAWCEVENKNEKDQKN